MRPSSDSIINYTLLLITTTAFALKRFVTPKYDQIIIQYFICRYLLSSIINLSLTTIDYTPTIKFWPNLEPKVKDGAPKCQNSSITSD